jgi:hypothetical protein
MHPGAPPDTTRRLRVRMHAVSTSPLPPISRWIAQPGSTRPFAVFASDVGLVEQHEREAGQRSMEAR